MASMGMGRGIVQLPAIHQFTDRNQSLACETRPCMIVPGATAAWHSTD
jgi:hypothetical protein